MSVSNIIMQFGKSNASDTFNEIPLMKSMTDPIEQ